MCEPYVFPDSHNNLMEQVWGFSFTDLNWVSESLSSLCMMLSDSSRKKNWVVLKVKPMFVFTTLNHFTTTQQLSGNLKVIDINIG